MSASAGPVEPSPPLWRWLQWVARLTVGVLSGRPLDRGLTQVPALWRPAVQSLAYTTLRRLAVAQGLRDRLARRRPSPEVDGLLLTALALLADEAATPYAPHTLVNQAVEAARASANTAGAAPFLNACLRHFLRERAALVAAVTDDPVARWGLPAWWLNRLRADHPDHWAVIAETGRAHPPMDLRVNRRLVSRDAYLTELSKVGLSAIVLGRDGVRLNKPVPVDALPGFASGWVSVQDAAAQLAAPMLVQAVASKASARSGRPRLLDACAAPGGKTAHLMEHIDADLLAIDVSEARAQRVVDNLRRLQLSAEVITADAGDPSQWWDGRPFDGILLDAPCTASGIVRRHPDIPWMRRASDVDALAATQRRLLNAMWPLLVPGGTLLFVTCSVFKAEGEGQIESFVAHNSDALHRPSPGHLLPGSSSVAGRLPDNPEGGHDGFFFALLEKLAR